ncbi:splicing factor U2AF subunit 65 kDa subunit [Monocercomonoides exilis]|uniref:splicing factor U2AF subunit 65 kDa subunit n=1 Tax=Monocercomonoides exilis TaxID=2049356 RepID=UPI00355A9CCC|nr:splicing factor U2AF subunit 65 kDa subunit [Monocercomonoides exilis]|eukprot:MONOS_7620.1-p1 / transcript=MONOS_7620.1 / gene=MONOS_7620 / organism=Monocercomonoides_exilis_PA203 / gene_product=splicing factor U2AF subunit 65 kDa subunit / transcript_product=splicing factor U2AF subunit 65 kDa subunit / location=Mono_scaffold00265:47233-48894(-) / protein_length=326 / sequence_SO=supercontig / SO=protein_coding / is_pseudo=false
MGLGGCVLKGVMLKIKRPKEYIPVDNDAASYQMLMASAASTSSHTSLSPSQGVSQPSFGYHPTPVSSATPASSMPVHSIPQPASTSLLAPGADNPNKIYIGNLPHTMTDGELLQLLSSIGHLKAINLVKEQGTSLNRGYAFCEYQDPSLTDIACSQLTGRVVKDKTIFAQRASIGAKKSTDVTTDQHLIQTLSTGGGTIITATSSRVVLFLNLCNEFDLVSDADFESILRDFTAECARYGTITAVVFPRPDETIRSRITDLTLDEKERDQTKLHLLGTIGRIYVKYSDPKEAQRAVSLINGCAFQGRTIITAFFKEELFDAGERL